MVPIKNVNVAVRVSKGFKGLEFKGCRKEFQRLFALGNKVEL